ncbi:unnamed protein product (macronuclear) [Paramecium tetraurelia]|uniref:Uncharacterized protein n=1 Tax=Paramecium tetraurelia TaxID=5888 RepID=A0D4E7_PARTE|nr:uncharacterized protein GSPATT00013380001 [Paramecium tetraurelia]CAK77914.1 unnamed protein product [Paramecium tetraurelia]|eukprot:XP_001445311.1 hypothetical protein (macronuclear) [Paramecium tetraurelia strain d4-2]
MGCVFQKQKKFETRSKRYSTNANTCITPDTKQSLEVYNPTLRKNVQVPILVPASKSNIMKRRSTQITTGM